jgi:Ca2+-binding EF-hand superfamily protein
LPFIQVIAHQSTTKEIAQLRKVFDQFDTGNDGIITFEEFKSAMKQMNFADKEMQEIFDSIVSILASHGNILVENRNEDLTIRYLLVQGREQ